MATLPPAPDPNALRNAILARLGLTAGQAAGFAGNTAFDDEITNYYRQAAGAMSNLDLDQARVGTDYEQNMANLILDRDRGRRAMEDMFADRGMLSSSNFTDELSRYETDFGQRQADLGSARTRSLEDILRGRNSVLEEFERNRMNTEGTYATQLQDYLLSQVRPTPAGGPAPATPIAAPAPVSRPVTPMRTAAPVRRAPTPVAPRVISPTVPKVAAKAINPWGGGSKPKVPAAQAGYRAGPRRI